MTHAKKYDGKLKVYLKLLGLTFAFYLNIVAMYSIVPTKRVGWKFFNELINVLFLINMLDGNFECQKGKIEAIFFIKQDILIAFTLKMHNIYHFNKKSTHKNCFLSHLFVVQQRIFMLISLNKRAGRDIPRKLINVLFLIRACWKENHLKNK